MRHVLIGLAAVCVLCPCSWGADPVVPADLVARHLARLDGLATLTFHIERQTTRKGKTHTERWTFRQKGPSRFRIDYAFPIHRVIVANERELWEYIPAARKAARTHLATLSPKQRAVVLRGVLARVAIEGLRFSSGGTGTQLRHCGSATVGGREAHRIECVRPDDKTTRLVRGWLDAERLVLLRSEFVGDGGHVLATTEAERVFEAAPGIWLPRRLTLKHLGGRGFKQVVTFRRVAINAELADTLFTFRPPDGVEVVAPGGK